MKIPANIRSPDSTDGCPCGTGTPYGECGPHTPDELEYSYLIGKFYPEGITLEIARRMLELETVLNLETLVPDEYMKKLLFMLDAKHEI